jgi:hypothetical protein
MKIGAISVFQSAELEKLFELKEKGVLTETEYTSLKYRIFNRNTQLR